MSKVVKTTAVLMIVTMITKVLGFIREIVLMNAYGLSHYSDVYITTMNIPVVIFAGIGTALATTFIPMYYEIREKEGDSLALKFANNIFNNIFIITIVIAIICFIFAEPLINIFAIGFKGETLVLAIKFIRIMIIGVIFIGLKSITTAYLQIQGNFIIPGLIGLPYNLIIIASIIVSLNGNIEIVAWGTLLAMLSQFLFQLPYAYKNGYRYSLYLNIRDKNVKKMIRLVIPVFIGVAVTQINVIVDRSISSTLVEGSISALNTANRLNEFVMGLFIATLASVIYPNLSKLSNEKKNDEFLKSIRSSVSSVILLVMPISIGAIVLANPIIKLLFERGAFDESSTKMTSIALVFYSIGMVSFGIREILSKVFYSIQDTKTPMINGAIAVSINIVLNIILSKYMGYAGIAFATSISGIICVILLFNNLSKKIGYFGQDKIIKTMVKSSIASVVMGVITYFSYNLLSGLVKSGTLYSIMSLFISILIGAVIYGLIITALKIEEVDIILQLLKRKQRRKTILNN